MSNDFPKNNANYTHNDTRIYIHIEGPSNSYLIVIIIISTYILGKKTKWSLKFALKYDLSREGQINKRGIIM